MIGKGEPAREGAGMAVTEVEKNLKPVRKPMPSPEFLPPLRKRAIQQALSQYFGVKITTGHITVRKDQECILTVTVPREENGFVYNDLIDILIEKENERVTLLVDGKYVPWKDPYEVVQAGKKVQEAVQANGVLVSSSADK